MIDNYGNCHASLDFEWRGYKSPRTSVYKRDLSAELFILIDSPVNSPKIYSFPIPYRGKITIAFLSVSEGLKKKKNSCFLIIPDSPLTYTDSSKMIHYIHMYMCVYVNVDRLVFIIIL